MSPLSNEMTVAQVAVSHPEAKPVLERLGIDYCCGGATTLGAAAEKAGRTVEEVWVEVEKAIADTAQQGGGGRDWSAATAGELARHILDTHHVFMKSQLPRLADLFEKVIAAHSERHGETLRDVQRVFGALRAEIDAHLIKEEQILFPYIQELDCYLSRGGARPVSHCGTVQNPIRQMIHEHDSAGAALARMRELTAGYTPPTDACASFEALCDGLKQLETDLHEHIHLENNILFPKAVQIEQQTLAES